MIKKELLMLLPWVGVMDGLIYICSLFFLGFNLSMVLGLLLGSGVMLLDFVLLGMATEESLQRGLMMYQAGIGDKGVKKSKFHMVSNYFLRYLLMGLAIFLGFKFGGVFNVFGVVLPLFFPKIIYVLQAAFQKRGRRNKKWKDQK